MSNVLIQEDFTEIECPLDSSVMDPPVVLSGIARARQLLATYPAAEAEFSTLLDDLDLNELTPEGQKEVLGQIISALTEWGNQHRIDLLLPTYGAELVELPDEVQQGLHRDYAQRLLRPELERKLQHTNYGTNDDNRGDLLEDALSRFLKRDFGSALPLGRSYHEFKNNEHPIDLIDRVHKKDDGILRWFSAAPAIAEVWHTDRALKAAMDELVGAA